MSNLTPLVRHFVFFLLTLLPALLSAQWLKTNGLPGGSVSDFAHYGDTTLAALGRLYFSVNDGQTWSPMGSPAHFNTYNLATDGHSIYVRGTTPGHRYFAHSTDFGQTWIPVSVADTMYFYDMFVAGPYFYGNDYLGLYRTSNDGATWEYVNTQPVGEVQFDGQRMIGYRHNCLVQSLDIGITWDTLLQFTGNVIDVLQNHNYLSVFLQNANDGCWSSSDAGQTWQHFTGTKFDQFYEFLWHDGAIYGLKGLEVIRSANLGQTWDTLPAPQQGIPAFRGISAGDALLLGGGNSGIFRSTDQGNSWPAANLGVTAESANRLRPIGTELFAPAHGNLYRLAPDGLNWSPLNFDVQPEDFYYYGFTDFVQIGNDLVVSSRYAPWVSTDGGSSWLESTITGPGYPDISQFESFGDRIVGFSDNYHWSDLYRSDDHGLNFMPLNTLQTQFSTQAREAVQDQGRLVVLAFDNKLYTSDDAGDHWGILSSTVPLDSLGASGINQPDLFVRGNSIFLFGEPYPQQKMLFSKDAGATWSTFDLTTANLPFGEHGFTDLLSVGTYLIAANDRGVFLSPDGGSNWSAWNDGLPNPAVSRLAVHDGWLWAGVDYDGIWKRSLTELDFQAVTGRVFYDVNTNGQYDAGEVGMANLAVGSTISNSYTTTRPDGTYAFLSNSPQEILQAHPPSAVYWTVTPSTLTTAVPANGADFALRLNPDARDLSINLVNVSALRPGFEVDYDLSWHNAIPGPAMGVHINLTYPPDLLDLVESTPPPTTQSAGILSWQLGDIAANAAGHFHIRFQVPATVAIGTTVCAEATIAATGGTIDLTPADNLTTHCAPVVGSYDPNDKQAEPGDHLTPAQIAGGEPVIYTIRFQNTGNYPATFMRILDTLSAYFDPGSFRILASSHPCTWTLRGAGEVEFSWLNIQLPPVTTDEPGSHGFVQYSVQARPNLPLGTPLRNTAHIFFDYNVPVVTNTTETVVSLPDAVQPVSDERLFGLAVFPNPAQAETWICVPAPGLIKVSDVSGRIIWQADTLAGLLRLDVRNWASGAYAVYFQGAGVNAERRLIICK